MTKKEYIQLILKNKPINRIYHIDKSLKTVISNLHGKFYYDDNETTVKPQTKMFYCKFENENNDIFMARPRESFWGPFATWKKYIHIHGFISSRETPVEISVDYLKGREIKTMVRGLIAGIFTIAIILILVKIPLSGLLFFIAFYLLVITFSIIITYRQIRKQILIFEKYILDI